MFSRSSDDGGKTWSEWAPVTPQKEAENGTR